MSIDIVKTGLGQLRLVKRYLHDTCHFGTAQITVHRVITLTGGAIAEDFRVDGGVSFLGVFQGFQDDGPGSFAQHQPIAIQFEWPRRLVGRIVAL